MSATRIEAITPVANFVSGRSRVSTLTLDWPVELNGTTYAAIGLRRLTAGEVSAFIESLQKMQKETPDAEINIRPPIFVTEAGEPLPDGLLASLDDDDAFRLDEAAEGFLPRRFRAAEAKRSSDQTDGSDTEPTS